MTETRPAVLLYCELLYGAGHWMRAKAVAYGLSSRFRVVLLLRGTPADELRAGGIETVQLPNTQSAILEELLRILAQVRPVAILLEYYPFGRQLSSFFLVPFIRAARSLPQPPKIYTSLRDVQDAGRPDQGRYDRRIAMNANQLVDGILVHSDPNLIALEETFSEMHGLTIPVYYTGYAVDPTPLPSPVPRENRIVVSAGGGRGSLNLLLSAVEAQRTTSLGRDYRMRIISGLFLETSSREKLAEAARGVPNLELLQWVPDLRGEISSAALSVSCCGYNTALDVLRTRTPALIFPAVQLGDEQRFRARKLEKLGLWRVLPENCVSGACLAEEIRRTAGWQPATIDIDCRGAERAATMIEELVSGKAPSALQRGLSGAQQNFRSGELVPELFN